MGRENVTFWPAIILAACFGFLGGMIAQHLASKADLIQRGLGEYCATDGRFAFKGECGE